MSGVRQNLINVCELIVDCEHKTAPTQETGYPSIRTPNIGRGRLILDGANRVSEKTYRTWSRRAIPQAEDLILAREAPIGNVAIIPKNLKVCLGQRTVLIRPDKSKVVPMFLAYLMLGDEIQEKLLAHSTGTTVGHLNMRDIRNLELPRLPRLPIQHKIAAILANYDNLIENNTRRIKILEEMAGTIYREWFVEFRFPGHENVNIVQSELGLIPQGWQIKKLSSLVETQYGYTESATEDKVGPKFVRGKDVNKTSYINWDSVPFCPINCEKYAKYRLHVNDILVIRMADPGKVAIVENDVEAVFASYLIRLNLTSNLVSPYYLFYSLLDRRYQDYIYGASTGTTRKSASAGVITDFDFVIPTSEVRDSFETVIALLRKGINNLLDKNANLRKTRDLLLPKLISGELDVSDLDIGTDLYRSQEGEKSYAA